MTIKIMILTISNVPVFRQGWDQHVYHLWPTKYRNAAGNHRKQCVPDNLLKKIK